MSWQAYIDTSLIGTGHVDKGAIISVAGDSCWANSTGYDIKPAEMKALFTILNGDESAKDAAWANGIHLNGERFIMARCEGRTIYCRSGTAGACIVKSGQAIIIAHHPEGVIAGQASATVEALVDYLIKCGY